MKRRQFINRIGQTAALAALAPSFAQGASEGRPDTPNIILFISDDHGLRDCAPDWKPGGNNKTIPVLT